MSRGDESFKNWDIEKWKSFIRDMHTMMSVSGIEWKGKSNRKNIDGKNIFFIMTQKIMMIEKMLFLIKWSLMRHKII